jgi:phosphatidylglycerophosphate synthase
MRARATIPLALTALRLLLAPVVIALALWRPGRIEFGACLVLAFVSDVFDGIIARRLNVATPALRRFDSITDSVFYSAVGFAAWHVHAGAIRPFFPALEVLVVLELSRYAFDFAKFRREASYHAWSSKLWGIFLFAGCFALLALGQGGLPVALAVNMGIIADMEGLLISITLCEWQSDVPSLVHAIRIRGARAELPA